MAVSRCDIAGPGATEAGGDGRHDLTASGAVCLGIRRLCVGCSLLPEECGVWCAAEVVGSGLVLFVCWPFLHLCLGRGWEPCFLCPVLVRIRLEVGARRRWQSRKVTYTNQICLVYSAVSRPAAPVERPDAAVL